MVRLCVCLDDHWQIGLVKQRTNPRANAGHTEFFPAVNDLVVCRNGDDDAVLLKVEIRRGIGSIDLDARFLDEDGRDDEEDEQDEDAIDHRRKIDFRLRLRFATNQTSRHP